MLYIDQPVQVGYSYDTPTNITKNRHVREFLFGNASIEVADFSNGVPEQNNTFLVGTSSSQNLTYTSNSTNHAAHALWHFAQTWFEEFKVYKPHDEKISLWTESYGGKYGPAFTTFFSQQNERIANGTISEPGAHVSFFSSASTPCSCLLQYLHLDTLGIINGKLPSRDIPSPMLTLTPGCIDAKYEKRAYAEFPQRTPTALREPTPQHTRSKSMNSKGRAESRTGSQNAGKWLKRQIRTIAVTSIKLTSTVRQ